VSLRDVVLTRLQDIPEVRSTQTVLIFEEATPAQDRNGSRRGRGSRLMTAKGKAEPPRSPTACGSRGRVRRELVAPGAELGDHLVLTPHRYVIDAGPAEQGPDSGRGG
jgi:hypothetical protein